MADAEVEIETEEDEDTGDLVTVIGTSATGLFGKPKLSAVDASIEQKEVDTGFFPVADVKVIGESKANVDARQLEKKANSGVIIAANVRLSSNYNVSL